MEVSDVTVNIAEKSAMIWNIADVLRGPFLPHEYGLVILPMTIIKRFHDCLLPTHDKVLNEYEKYKHLEVIDGFLCRASGYQFYNRSKYTFERLLADADNIEQNFRDYLSGFSDNVLDILSKLEFDGIIKRMVESNTLYLVIKEFASQKGYLGPDKVSAVDCGYIFEDLVRRFNESYGSEAGEHFTSRDIIYLMTDILLCDKSPKDSITVYDMAMGTSQMLSCMEERIHALDSETSVICFGQEYQPQTFAIAKADMMIRGGSPDNMKFGDTLSNDRFSGYTFDYIISNPPFGIDWKKEKTAVEAEAKKTREQGSRFFPGLPKISDGQQLFVLNGIAKLADGGKMAIIQNGSPLFAGDAGSGPSEIRRYILENDLLDAIIGLSTDAFMNTGIATYIWVISKNKPSYRAGKVQLIDASHCYEPRRKSIGNKRNDITEQCRDLIVRAYGDFANGVYGDKSGIYCESKIFEYTEFGYSKITVERPLRDEAGNIVMKKGNPVPDASLRDTENVPLCEDIEEYFKREVLPYAPDAWIDRSKTKVGYEIPMTRYFYEYKKPEKSEDILMRIRELEAEITEELKGLLDE